MIRIKPLIGLISMLILTACVERSKAQGVEMDRSFVIPATGVENDRKGNRDQVYGVFHSVDRTEGFETDIAKMEMALERSELSGHEAILKSLILPGWGHKTVNPSDWKRGRVHMAVEVIITTGLVRSVFQEQRYTSDYKTLARLKAGVSLNGKPRSFALALADYNTLEEYNAQMLRSRQWNRLIEETPEYQWHWLSQEDRESYRELRADADRADRQIPALISLMVTNRIISAFSAYNRARKAGEGQISLRLDPVWMTSEADYETLSSSNPIPVIQGVQASFRVTF